jgi:hypothetical protein
MEEKFNYCVAHYWSSYSGAIGTYMYHNDVFYGTIIEAEEFLKYVKIQSPNEDWRIFKVIPL